MRRNKKNNYNLEKKNQKYSKNISSKELSIGEINLLAKGLKFVLTLYLKKKVKTRITTIIQKICNCSAYTIFRR